MNDDGGHKQAQLLDIQKVSRLLQYLLKLASLRAKLVRTIDAYDDILWILNVPHDRSCFTQAWGRDADREPDVWLEVRHSDEPALPAVPAQCEGWVNLPTIRKKDELPELLGEITRQAPNPEWHEGSDEEPQEVTVHERLADYPNIQAAWDRYVEQEWLPWTERHNAWEKAHKVYSKLFAIHQAQLRLGEEYELVLGLGLLTWQTPTGQRVRRHLVVADASSEFEAKLGRFTVRARADGAKLRPELDMLDIEEQPVGAEHAAKTGLSSAKDDPWDKSCVEGVLQALVHSISPQGEYVDSGASRDIHVSAKPVVELAPALILRKRSSKGLIAVLQRIKEQVEAGVSVPDEFSDLAEARQKTDREGTDSSGGQAVEPDGEIFFPKLSNDAQRQIVGKIRSANGVLVQGPPGTGKSHTIANLICHLLATGQRILVTAKTPRALQVLEGLLPGDVKPLCINLLGAGTEERAALERSVGGILRKNEEWSEPQAAQKRKELERRLRGLRAEQSDVNRHLRAIRESETHEQSVADGAYRGTAARIAEAVSRDCERYSWFTDKVPLHQSCRVSPDDLMQALNAFLELTADKRAELALTLPTNVPAAEHFAELIANEANAIGEERDSEDGGDGQLAAVLARSGPTAIERLLGAFAALRSARSRLPTSTHPWLVDALRDIAAGTASPWRELFRATQVAISTAEQIVAVADDTELRFPDGTEPRRLRDDARVLQQHMKAGGKLGWGPFRPRSVRERLYILKLITVNGRVCSSPEDFSILGDTLDARIACDSAWRSWVGRHNKVDGPCRLQLAMLKSLRDTLMGALATEELVGECRESLKPFSSVIEHIWTDARIETITSSCRLALARIRARVASEQIQHLEIQMRTTATMMDAHPVATELLSAIKDRNVTEFARGVDMIKRLEAQQRQARDADERLLELRRVVPHLAKNIEETANDGRWEERAHHVDSAWRWSQARYWMEEYIRKEDAPALEARTKQIMHLINDTLVLLASLHAWSFCFGRMDDGHRRHMEAWQQAMRKLGKGTGRHAWKHRQDAQEHLNVCREAVPAWVMPLHRIWDTINPTPSMFDVVIVDEASQCGLEALPLFYLGKKILIVGDDKQISPEAVGLDRDQVTRLGQEFLSDFEFRSTFGAESSLFDQGKLRYGTSRITLREHFRCMPEIIQFSNDLCYSDTPLIPLRQYGPDRLPPLERVFVNDGRREGYGSRVINRPEAEAIVERIYEMCRDDRYNGKTMGVVVLQGEAQAKLIESQLLEQVGAEEMERRRLVCGDAYSFQGDERHIMFLSLVAAPNMTIGTLSKAADERRFNVAASRAQDMMILFHSVECNDLSARGLRRRLLEFFQTNRPPTIAGLQCDELERHAVQDNRGVVSPPSPFESWFEVDVALELLRRGYTVVPQFAFGGRRIDLVVQGGNAKLAVECDGDYWHGADAYEDDMQRQRQLERCGWEFCRIRESVFRANKDFSLKRLWEALEERGICPSTANVVDGSEVNGERQGASIANDVIDSDESDEMEDSLQVGSETSSSASGRNVEDITIAEIEAAIVQALSKCANNTCTAKSITTRVLRECGVLTRGRPREVFERRTMRCVGKLEAAGRIKTYKSKNQRLRLVKRGWTQELEYVQRERT
jgi:very-short-patch-repair endonuclease